MKEIFARASVRSFLPDPVGEDKTDLLLRAAMAAPSAGNEQPWEFVVVQDREVIDGIQRAHPHARMLSEAPACVVICADTARAKFDEPFWIQDCSAATENLLLVAVHLGLSAVWLGVWPIEERVKGLQELLGMPETVIPFSAVALGVPKTPAVPRQNYDPSRIHRERW